MDSGTSKIVVVTGASRGLGQAAAREIARRGHTVVATMRNPADFVALKDAEGTFDFERMDVDDPGNVNAALGSVEARHGRIDVLINNAGYGLYGAVEDLSEEEVTGPIQHEHAGHLAHLPGSAAGHARATIGPHPQRRDLGPLAVPLGGCLRGLESGRLAPLRLVGI